MPDDNDRLSRDLQDYYRQLERHPAPDVVGRVMLAADTRAMRLRRFAGVGGGVLAVAAVAAVIALALVNHRSPTSAPVAPAGSPTPSVTAGPTESPTTAPTNTPSAPPVAVGPAVHGFVPTDVTAISASEWWVLGYDGPSCSSASCTRILHTMDGGHRFSSIPVPHIAPAPPQGQSDRLRFGDGNDAWLVSSSRAVWSTHNGGGTWTQDVGAGSVTDLEASDGRAYAIACGAKGCILETSAANEDAWSTLPGSATNIVLKNLLVTGSHIWAIAGNPGQAQASLMTSTDGGQTFSTHQICSPDLGISDVYAVNASVLWATCPTGSQAAVLLSTDGGQHFATVSDPGIQNSASIGGVSSSIALVGEGQSIVRSTDGGHTFATVASADAQFSILGFTSSTNGFAFSHPASGPTVLWRTNDAGAHWYQVGFP